MKSIQVIKHLWPFQTVSAKAKGAGHVQELVLGSFCFLMFLALGPFAAIPAFFATFSIPKWIEEERGEKQ